MSVTAVIPDNEIVCSDLQFWNVCTIVVTVPKPDSETDCSSRQLLNMLPIVVVLCATSVARSKKLSKTACVPPVFMPPNRTVVAFGADNATSSHGATVFADVLAE